MPMISKKSTLVSQGMEEIIGFDSLLTSLLVAEDKINPLMQMLRDVLWL